MAMNALDWNRIRARSRERNLSFTELSRRVGISRQGLHRLTRPGYRPMPDSIARLAAVLDMEPWEMLQRSDSKLSDIAVLLDKARNGSPRAFELLPARLSARPEAYLHFHNETDVLKHRLLAAAAATANHLWPNQALIRAAETASENAGHQSVFIFHSPFIPLEILLNKTPEPMRRTQVFGIFEMDDFKRHGEWD
jgi:transcriptional regulator with XRE-family HTH domain